MDNLEKELQAKNLEFHFFYHSTTFGASVNELNVTTPLANNCEDTSLTLPV